ncbi:hypothetical protein ACFVT9_29380 [Kitasatospora cineracea]|uniref:hypothetical protein n=1 Tax=Kitasatospora cineracea TaxID=88074 RepID=UPI0036D77F04
MTAHTPDQHEHADDDLVFPALGQPQFGGDDEDQGEHPDVIWHRPRRPASTAGRPSDLVLVLVVLAVLAATVLLAVLLAPTATAAWHWITEPAHTTVPLGRIWHTVTDPIHRSLQQRGAGLPAGTGTLYGAWAAAGVVILLIALRRGASVGVQLGAVLFGAVTVAAVWDGTDAPGRPVAAGLAVLIWAVLAALALTGSWITTHTTVLNTVQPAPAPDVVIDVAPAQLPAPVVEVTVPEPRIETVLVVDPGGDARRTSRPDQ